MFDLKNMSDYELAQRVVNYVERLRTLMDDVSNVLGGPRRTGSYELDRIKDDYKRLKEEIKSDAHYVRLSRNRTGDFDLYTSIFVPSISEADASGFTSPTNSRIDQRFFSSIEEAHYKLTKYHGLDEWKKMAGV